ncbi:hypothetical protein D6745_05550 [Candidatus Woesearchaeota archaeon]|nr:MAG: hypothetical protein D6745_05550 [Candidatus Woesearchaeota archaeon]
MNKIIKDSILTVLRRMRKALKQRDSHLLAKLSNFTIHNSSIFQDEDSITTALVAYALSKIIAREKDQISDSDVDYIRKAIQKLQDHLRKNQEELFRDDMNTLIEDIKRLDSKVSIYFDEILQKSRIKKGSAIYSHGISLARVAKILGVSQWELMSYVGNTRIIDEEEKESVKKRLAFARSLFELV